MITANYQNDEGDSGGAVKAVWSSSTYVVGIHHGRLTSGSQDAVFSDMTRAKNDLGFGGYYD